jgi:uncharacterized membrane protein YfcA
MENIGAFLIGLASGLVGAISTGGGLISIPGLVFLGQSPISAIATTRLSALSGGTASLFKYHKGKAVAWHYLPVFMVISLIAGIIGPKLLVQIDKDMVEQLIGVSMLVMLPLLVFRKNFGTVKRTRQRKHHLLGMFFLFLVMIYGTMFGAGGGIFLISVLIYFFGMTVTEANATGTAMWLIGTTAALIAYISHGAVDFGIGIPLLAGALLGGYTGAHIALKKGTVWVKWFLVVVVTLSSIKLIFF